MTTETAAELEWNPAKAKAYLRKRASALVREVRDIRENLQEWGDSEEEFRLGLSQTLGDSVYGVEYSVARAKGMTVEEAEAVADRLSPEGEA